VRHHVPGFDALDDTLKEDSPTFGHPLPQPFGFEPLENSHIVFVFVFVFAFADGEMADALIVQLQTEAMPHRRLLTVVSPIMSGGLAPMHVDGETDVVRQLRDVRQSIGTRNCDLAEDTINNVLQHGGASLAVEAGEVVRETTGSRHYF
jgi:hypothetical protein